MFHHQAIVGCDIGLTLNGIDNHTLSLGRRRWGQFDEGGETGAAHTHDTSLFYTGDNLLGCQFGMRLDGFQLIGTVDGLFPLIAFHIDDNHGLTVAGCINGGIDLKDRATHRRINRGRHKTTGLGNQRTYLHLVAFLDNWLGRLTDMLTQWEDGLLGQGSHLCGNFVGQFVFLRVDTTYSESSGVHTVSSFLLD